MVCWTIGNNESKVLSRLRREASCFITPKLKVNLTTRVHPDPNLKTNPNPNSAEAVTCLHFKGREINYLENWDYCPVPLKKSRKNNLANPLCPCKFLKKVLWFMIPFALYRYRPNEHQKSYSEYRPKSPCSKWENIACSNYCWLLMTRTVISSSAREMCIAPGPSRSGIVWI